MPQIRVRIDNHLYRRLKDTVLRTRTWEEVVNEALSDYLIKYENDDLEKRMELIIKYYYKINSIRRVLSMYIYLNKEYQKLMTMPEFNEDRTTQDLIVKIMDEIRRLHEEIKKIEEEITKRQLEEIRKEKEEEET